MHFRVTVAVAVPYRTHLIFPTIRSPDNESQDISSSTMFCYRQLKWVCAASRFASTKYKSLISISAAVYNWASSFPHCLSLVYERRGIRLCFWLRKVIWGWWIPLSCIIDSERWLSTSFKIFNRRIPILYRSFFTRI